VSKSLRFLLAVVESPLVVEYIIYLCLASTSLRENFSIDQCMLFFVFKLKNFPRLVQNMCLVYHIHVITMTPPTNNLKTILAGSALKLYACNH
jgi:hypothetical protein